MPQLSILIKPVSSSCNLMCKYCFYNSISENRSIKSYRIMSLKTLENIVTKVLDETDKECTFAFQGGEPTLAGLDFFKELIKLENRFNVKNLKINNILQTNATLIDEKWGKFLHDNNFLVGVSLDGPKDINIDAKG